MGRVAKYKKVKKFDRLHSSGEYVWGSMDGIRPKKKKRSQTAEKLHQQKLKRKKNRILYDNGDGKDGGFDLPPQGKDEFNLTDLKVKKMKRRKLDEDLISTPSLSSSSSSSKDSANFANNTTTTTTDVLESKVKVGNKMVTCTIPQNDKEERRIAKILNIDTKSGLTMTKGSSSDIKKKIEGRRDGESMRAFNRRLKEETKLALAQDFKDRASNKKNKNQHDIQIVGDDSAHMSKKDRRKEFMKNKKKLKKRKNGTYDESMEDNRMYDNDNDDNNNATQSDFITGENAYAMTTAKPSFLEQVEAPPTFNRLPRGAEKKSKMKIRGEKDDGKKMDEKSIKAEQNAMEVMRKKVQVQYALLKAKRRKEGNFHL
jgi:hypothetical protein